MSNELDIDTIKLYCRIDDAEEDMLIHMMRTAAENYLLNAGIPKVYTDFTYKLTILTIIRYYYDERISSGAPEACDSAIIQLQLKYGGQKQ